MSFEEGALLEPTGVAMRAVEQCEVQPGETIVVNGLWPSWPVGRDDHKGGQRGQGDCHGPG